MPSKIQCGYSQLQTVSNTFSKEAGETEGLYGKINSMVDNLRNTWNGKGSASFQAEMDVILPNMKKLVDALETSSSQVKALSDVFNNAENDISLQFKSAIPKLLNFAR
jgi:WXG100 family type VII secretion target